MSSGCRCCDCDFEDYFSTIKEGWVARTFAGSAESATFAPLGDKLEMSGDATAAYSQRKRRQDDQEFLIVSAVVEQGGGTLSGVFIGKICAFVVEWGVGFKCFSVDSRGKYDAELAFIQDEDFPADPVPEEGKTIKIVFEGVQAGAGTVSFLYDGQQIGSKAVGPALPLMFQAGAYGEGGGTWDDFKIICSGCDADSVACSESHCLEEDEMEFGGAPLRYLATFGTLPATLCASAAETRILYGADGSDTWSSEPFDCAAATDVQWVLAGIRDGDVDTSPGSITLTLVAGGTTIVYVNKETWRKHCDNLMELDVEATSEGYASECSEMCIAAMKDCISSAFADDPTWNWASCCEDVYEGCGTLPIAPTEYIVKKQISPFTVTLPAEEGCQWGTIAGTGWVLSQDGEVTLKRYSGAGDLLHIYRPVSGWRPYGWNVMHLDFEDSPALTGECELVVHAPSQPQMTSPPTGVFADAPLCVEFSISGVTGVSGGTCFACDGTISGNHILRYGVNGGTYGCGIGACEAGGGSISILLQRTTSGPNAGRVQVRIIFSGNFDLAVYRTNAPAWTGLTPLTLSLFSSHPQCDNWPGSITVNPA